MVERFRQPAQADPLAHSAGAGPVPGPPLALPRRALPSVAGLIAFEAAARHRSLSRAARELDLSQGAVSKRLRQLEDSLGTVLLDRNRQHVCLTPAGRAYLARATHILAQLDAASELIAPRRGEAPGSVLTVAVSPGLGAHWLVPRLPGFCNRHPGTFVNLVTRTALPTAPEETPDAAVVPRPQAAAAPAGYSEIALFAERLLPAAAPALIAEAGLHDPAALAAAPLLERAGRPDQWEAWFAAARHAGPVRPPVARHDSLALLMAAAEAGLGVALLPACMVAAAAGRRRLEPVSALSIPGGRNLVLAVPRAAGERAAVRSFARWIAAEAAAERDGMAGEGNILANAPNVIPSSESEMGEGHG